MSFLRAPSVVWGIVVTIGFVILIGKWQRYLAGVAGARDGGGAAGRDPVPRHLLVAVLQDPHRGPGRRRRPADRHLGERRPAPDHAVGHAAPAGGTAVRLPLRAIAGEPAGQRADHRRRLRLRRRDRPVQGRQAHRRRRHRPADHGDRRREEPRPSLRRPAGHPARQRRPRVPGDHRQQVRPDPVRAARLAGPGHRGLADPAGELPVHRTGPHRRPRAPDARRRLLDVQLLPRGLADRPAGRHRGGRLRAHPLRRPARRRPGRGHGGAEREQPVLRDGVRRRPGTSSRRPPTTGRSCTSRVARSRRCTCGRWPASC